MPLLPDVDAKLTLTRVANAPALVAEIARMTGQRLEVSPALRTEVLMVSVDSARVADVLAKLAVAATASWHPDEGGLRLVPDNAARGIEARRERAQRLQAIVEARRKKDAKMKNGDADDGLAGALMGSRSVDAFVPMLDLNALAAMETGDRVVFATNANAAQRSLLGNPERIVAEWIEAHNKSAEKASAGLNALPEGMDAIMKGPLGERMRREGRTIVGHPTKIVVVASRGAMPFFAGTGLDIRLEVRAYAGDGSVLIEQAGTLDTAMMDAIKAMTVKKSASPMGNRTTPIEYSADAKALAGLSGAESLQNGGAMPEKGGISVAVGGTKRGPKLSPSLRARLMAPTKNDLLALLPGEGLVALAKARRKPLVACLPDAAYPTILGNAVPKTVEDLEASLKDGPMQIVPDIDFLVVKAVEPETARETRLDRTALEDLLKASNDHESPTLDELADFASRTAPPSCNPVTTTMLTLFVPSAMGSMNGLTSWEGLRLYAALSPAQRESLAAGAKIPFGMVSTAGQSALGAMLYGASNSLSVERPGVSNEPDPLSLGLKMALGGGGIDARDEPTEIAPNGLPTNGYLQASVASEPIVRPLTSDGPGASSVSVDELAMIHLMAGSPMAARMGDAMNLPDSGRLGVRTVWSIKGYVASGAYVSATLNDDRTPEDGPVVSLSNLPDDLKVRVAQRTDKIKSSPLGAILSMAGAGKSAPREP